MGSNDDFICALLLPLAGSTTEELTDEENEQLPIDLQYLPVDKQRELDRDIQQILLETILLVGRSITYLNFTILALSSVMCNETGACLPSFQADLSDPSRIS